jgi:hypothetical protein
MIISSSFLLFHFTQQDYIDAYEKLTKLNLKGKQDREIANVLLHCACMENHYNKYYETLAHTLTTQNHHFKFSFQFLLWDEFKRISTLTPHVIHHMARFYSFLIGKFSLSLSILKVLDFAHLSSFHIFFLRTLFCSLLCEFDGEVLSSVFQRLGHSFRVKKDDTEVGMECILGVRMFLVSCIRPIIKEQSSPMVADKEKFKANLQIALNELKHFKM